MADAVGSVVQERYELLEEIGRGGHSSVFRARDRLSEGTVAVKMLHEAAAANPEFAVRLVREHRAMSALDGTAAVRSFGLATSAEGALCLVMELLGGTDLDHLLESLEAQGQRLGVGRLLTLLGPIVDTLERAHAAGIVHRDLKPGNIQVLPSDGVRLLDFGLAKVASSPPLTKDGMILGSPSYIAPEVWAGKPAELDHRVDIYSLGAIVFRALAGRVPFEGESIPEKLRLSTTAPRPSLHALRSDLPPSVDEWVAQSLAIDRDSRFFRVRAMWNALHGALDVSSTTGGRGGTMVLT